MQVSIFRPGMTTRRLSVSSPAVIGRATGCQIQLGDSSVEPQHARLTSDPRGVLVEALDGRVHYEQSLIRSAIVRDREEIVVGRFVLALCREPSEVSVPKIVEPTAREAALVAAIAANPGDRAMRDVYADELEEQGDAERAAFVRDGVLDPVVLLRTSPSWRTITSRGTIEYCGLGNCPRRWDALSVTASSLRRRCYACGCDVEYCTSIADVVACGQDDRPFIVDPTVRRDHAFAGYRAAPHRSPPHAARAAQLPLLLGPRLPTTLAALETALQIHLADDTPATSGYVSTDHNGSLSRLVVWLRATCAWDMYHEGPPSTVHDARSRAVTEYDVALSPDPEIAVALERRFNVPQSVARDGRTLLRYGPFFLDPERGSLAWYAQTPAWAIAIDEAVRDRFLVDLVATVASSETLAMLVRTFPQPPATAGVESDGPLNPDDYWFHFNPPISALRFAAALGWTDVTAFTGSVHMSTWHLQSDGSRPRCGVWIIDAMLTQWPRSDRDNAPRCRLIAQDLVGSVRIVFSPRDKNQVADCR